MGNLNIPDKIRNHKLDITLFQRVSVLSVIAWLNIQYPQFSIHMIL